MTDATEEQLRLARRIASKQHSDLQDSHEMLCAIVEAIQATEAYVAAWMRGEVPSDYTDPGYDIGVNLATGIERGAHLKGQPHD